MRKYTDYVIDREGNAVVGAEIYVRDQDDNSLVQLYSDDGSTTTANPTTTDSDGKFSFWTANNTLKLEVYIDGVEEAEITHVQHYDIDGISSFGFSLIDDADAATARATLGIDALDGLAALADPNADRIVFWDDSAGDYAYLAPSTGLSISGTNLTVDNTAVKPTESLIVACSDETTDLTTGTAKLTFRMPYAFTLSAVRASVVTAPTDAALTVDINEGGVSILSTKLTIDSGEKTSTTAATPAVISDASLADDAEITIDIDQVGSTVAGAGLKVTFIGTRT